MQWLKRLLSSHYEEKYVGKLEEDNLRMRAEIDLLRAALFEKSDFKPLVNSLPPVQNINTAAEEPKQRLSNWNEIRLELERKTRRRSIANA